METPSSPLTSIRFDEARRGYSRLQVDTFLIDLGDKIAELQELWRTTNQGALDAEAQLAAAADAIGITLPTDEPPTPFVRDEDAAPLAILTFTEERKGYDKGEVDYFLREAGHKVAELQRLYQLARERRVTAEMRLAVLEREAPSSAPSATPPPTPGTAVSSSGG